MSGEKGKAWQPIELSAMDPRLRPRGYSPPVNSQASGAKEPTLVGDHLAMVRTSDGKPMFLGDSALHGALSDDAETLLRDSGQWVEETVPVESSEPDLTVGAGEVTVD